MVQTIIETPKVKYTELDSNPTLTGEGSQIPIIIGITGNATPTSGIQKFKNYDACCQTVANGGIGTDTTTNPLLAFCKDFFEEAKKINADDIGIPYIYVIDLGVGRTTTEGVTTLNTNDFLSAMDLAKSVREIQAEVYVGFEKTDTANQIIPILYSAVASNNTALSYIKADSENGNPRIAYFTVAGMNDTELIALTDDSQSKFVQDSRLGLCEPDGFGKTMARIFVTPFYEEPGYYQYRSVNPGTFKKRTPAEELALQNAGIIFNHDERAGSYIYPKINLAVSTAFAKAPSSRPNDCLIHMRRNVDQLIREAYEVLYLQLKRNETETNLTYTQADLDELCDSKIEKGHMMPGTQITSVESDIVPYNLKAEGVAVPVNSTLLIGFSMYVEQPNVIAGNTQGSE